MNQLILTIIVAVILLAAFQWPIAKACRKNPAIAKWRPVLLLFSVLWVIWFVIRVYYLDDLPGARADSIYHDQVAHQVADFIRAGDMQSAFQLTGVGNVGFEFVVGVFYAVTGAPTVVAIGICTLLAFCGLLTLLDVVIRSTQATSVPFWVVFIICMYPEALFWSTDLLKEGPLIWGMCTMLRFVVPDPTKRGISRWRAPLAGTIVFMFLRPHIAFAWLVAIGMTKLIKQKQWLFGAVIFSCAVVSVILMAVLAPRLMGVMAQRGLLDTLDRSIQSLTARDAGGSAISYQEGSPIPIVSGAVLLFLRPFPWEAPHAIGLLAGAEVWILTTVAVFSWMNLKNRRRFLFSPMMLTSLFTLLFLAFFFSWMYNLGLMVRYRIQAFPALVVLAATPGLVRRSPVRPGASRVAPFPPYRPSHSLIRSHAPVHVPAGVDRPNHRSR